MVSILLKNMPDALHRTLRQRATQHKRSLSREVVDILQRDTVRMSANTAAVKIRLARAAKFRASLRRVFNPQDIDGFKREGRL